MAYTTSIRCGSSYSVKHNKRDKALMEKEAQREREKGLEPHINKDGECITLRSITEQDAYHKIFDKALQEYNQGQIEKGHPERQIENYLEHIKNQKGKTKPNTSYEIIVQVGNHENRPTDRELKQIYQDYLNTWKERNPNLIMIGAYFHNDEPKGTPHLHIDYIGIKHCDKGMSVQVSQKGAFKEQGFITKGYNKDTAQMQWQESENEALQEICKKYNIEINNPHKVGTKRVEKENYHIQQRNEELKMQNDVLQQNIAFSNQIIKAKEDKIQNLQEIEENLGSIEQAQEYVQTCIDYINDRGLVQDFKDYLEEVALKEQQKDNYDIEL